jgi:hypothetical protein
MRAFDYSLESNELRPGRDWPEVVADARHRISDRSTPDVFKHLGNALAGGLVVMDARGIAFDKFVEIAVPPLTAKEQFELQSGLTDGMFAAGEQPIVVLVARGVACPDR